VDRPGGHDAASWPDLIRQSQPEIGAMSRSFDAIIIGAGQAGPFLAVRLGEAGMKVAIVERKLFGGTCVNAGCTPTKTLVASAHAAHLARRAAEFGVVLGGDVGVDMKQIRARQDAIVRTQREGVEQLVRNQPNCTVCKGQARFESARRIRVGGDLLTADKIFINVGGRANIPALPGVDQVTTLTNTGLLDLDELPRHLVVVGGSYVGLEFAQIYRRFGAKVTVIEMAQRLIQREDPDISAAVQTILEAENIQVRLAAECIHFEPRGADVGVGVDCETGDPEIVGSHVLLAVGRRPNTDDLGLEAAGVEVDKRGTIVVDESLQTTAPGVWALGDCNGKGAFTHTAYNDFEIVAGNLLDGEKRRVSDRITAYALFTDPPLGRVGLSEAEARATGKRLLIGSRPMTQVGRAVEKGETLGFMKVVVDAETQNILGAAILGTEGDEAIHGILDTMYAKANYQTLQRAVHIHPTVSELIPTMLDQLKPLESSAEFSEIPKPIESPVRPR
jgi:pyruvate/2-oxoglutarate dehydrogenase complex dihydrolipoamide dehydrogenase (E3) component